MVNYSPAELDHLFHAMSDATRRAILVKIAQKECTAGELARPFNISKPAITKHLRVLEEAKLLNRSKNGRIHRCRLNPRSLQELSKVIRYYNDFWEGSLNHLEDYLKQKNEKEKKNG